MRPLDRIRTYADELTALRHDIHAHPESASRRCVPPPSSPSCSRVGIEVHRGLGRTGVVGELKGA